MLRVIRGHVIVSRGHFLRRQSELLRRYNNRMLLQMTNTVVHLDCAFSFISTKNYTSLQEWMVPSRRLRLLKKC